MGYKMKNKGNFNFGNKGNFDWHKGEGSIGDPVNYNDPDVKKQVEKLKKKKKK